MTPTPGNPSVPDSGLQPNATTQPTGIDQDAVRVVPPSVADGVYGDGRYLIGTDDVLEIRFYKHPELSRESVRVDGRGMIRMPLINEEVRAVCLTESELGQELARRYLLYYRNPQVDVFIKEYNARPVAVIGAVERPGRFQLNRRVRLLEMISFANGFNEKAGRNAQIIHNPQPTRCLSPSINSAGGEPDELITSFDAYVVTDLLRGKEEANPFVEPGDIVFVPEADIVYVTGNVVRPSSIPVKTEKITLTEAIAAAGGTLPLTKDDKIRIVRQIPNNGGKTEFFVDLKAIAKERSADVVLEPNDIVEVSVSAKKRTFAGIINALTLGAAQVPLIIATRR